MQIRHAGQPDHRRVGVCHRQQLVDQPGHIPIRPKLWEPHTCCPLRNADKQTGCLSHCIVTRPFILQKPGMQQIKEQPSWSKAEEPFCFGHKSQTLYLV
jgi:hypothetical protein